MSHVRHCRCKWCRPKIHNPHNKVRTRNAIRANRAQTKVALKQDRDPINAVSLPPFA